MDDGLPVFGSVEFWAFYDQFCTKENLTELVAIGECKHSRVMNEIMRAAHESLEIHHLSRSERGWNHHMAWLSLKSAPIRNSEGNPTLYMRSGDVVVVQHAWDRDVPITHVPICGNIVSGYLLSGKWPEMVGLFMPLFDHATIMQCIELRLEQNMIAAMEKALKESASWGWYET